MGNIIGDTNDPKIAAVLGESTNDTNAAGPGVHGVSKAVGVFGESRTWHGVVGFSKSTTGGFGVYGEGLAGGPGVVGKSTTWHAVAGFSESTTGGFGVYGEGVGPGVVGVSKTWHGVYGETPSAKGGAGVMGEHKAAGVGVLGVSKDGVGVYGKGGRLAGFFEGDVEVTGDMRLANADCAEDFDIADADSVEPGSVMVLGDEGALRQSHQPYDKRVAGVISGAGAYKPGIVLDKQPSQNGRKPIALLGKVYCKVDARYASIEVGDLLTTSASPGHAMKALEPLRTPGAVIGKALRPLISGRGLIPILVALQ